MDPARVPRASDLYHAALQHSAAERARFLDDACCGDDTLRREVESLLAFERGSEEFLETPAFAALREDMAGNDAADLTGRTVAGYRILSRLGAGGMGEVYRARDSRLGRDVALKILPPHFTADVERRVRFAREARLLATLSHAHIGAIYGVEESAGITALVLELVEGPTLADRLESGPLPVTQALTIARQVAEALDTAHEKGVVHRDLKPANIVLQDSDYGVRAKVLDFGLAKSMADGARMERSESTETVPGDTACGRILGTPAYMSPEQARGLPVDRRTDVWAFGCVLFEMLSGKRPFEAGTANDTIAQVLECEPDWEGLPASVHEPVRSLLRRCLRKDPSSRIRDVRDALLELDDRLAEGRTTPARRTGVPGARWLLAVVALVATASVAWWLGSTSAVSPLKPPGMRLTMDLGPDVSLGSAINPTIGISPDGERLVFVSGGRLMTRRLQDSAAVPLAGTEGVSTFFLSPDSRSVAFTAQGRLKRVTLDGGSLVTICEIPSVSPRGGTWGEDGTIILANLTGGLTRVPAEGGSLEAISRLQPGEFTQRWPQYLPGARAVVFTSHQYPDWFDRAHVDVLSLADGRRKTLVTDASFGRFAAALDGTGYLTFVRAGTLFAMPFDPVRLDVQGSAFPIVDHVAYVSNLGFSDVDISRTGTLIFREEVKAGLKWVGDAAAEPVLPGAGDYREPIFSEDGTRVAFAMAGDLWVYDLQRRISTQVTKGVPATGPLWTPDGRFLVFSTFDNIAWVASDGGAEPKPLLPPAPSAVRYPTSIRRIGDHLVLGIMQLQVGSPQAWDLWTVELANEGAELRTTAPRPYLKTRYDERQLALSPDGRWVAYNSNESGSQQEVYVRAFPDDGRRWKISDGGGMVPQWAPERPLLFFQGASRQLMAAAYSTTNGTFVPGAPKVWSSEPVLERQVRVYSIRRSDTRVAALLRDPAVEQQSDHVVALWTDILEELERRSAGRR